MTSHRAPLLTLAALVASSGCALVSGPSQLSVEQLAPTPPSLMIAKRSPRTAYLVLDPARVPAELPVLVAGQDRGGKLVSVQSFVERDLRRVLNNYFAQVEVVAPGAVPANKPHVVVDVKLERVEVLQTSRRQDGIVTHTAGAAMLTWGLGMRASDEDEYLFSFAGESVGVPNEDPNFVFRSMLEAALSQLLKGYTEKKVHQRVMGLPGGEAPGTTAASEL